MSLCVSILVSFGQTKNVYNNKYHINNNYAKKIDPQQLKLNVFFPCVYDFTIFGSQQRETWPLNFKSLLTFCFKL